MHVRANRYMIGSYLREGGALSPDGTVLTEDGSGREADAGLAFDLAHQMLIDVSLPRHDCLISIFTISFSLSLNHY